MKKFSLAGGILLCLVVFSACEKVVLSPPPPLASFPDEIRPILVEQCAACHSTWGDTAKIYNILLSEGIIDTAHIYMSPLYREVKEDTSHVKEILSGSDEALIARWIEEGALNRRNLPPVVFSTQVAPVIVSKCKSCHSDWSNASTLYNTWVKEGVLDPDNINGSKIYKSVNNNQPHKPSVTPAEKETILRWLKEGAKNN